MWALLFKARLILRLLLTGSRAQFQTQAQLSHQAAYFEYEAEPVLWTASVMISTVKQFWTDIIWACSNICLIKCSTCGESRTDKAAVSID